MPSHDCTFAFFTVLWIEHKIRKTSTNARHVPWAIFLSDIYLCQWNATQTVFVRIFQWYDLSWIVVTARLTIRFFPSCKQQVTLFYRILFDNLLKFNEPYNVNDLVLSNLNYTYNTNKLTVLFEINDYCRHFIYNILSCVSRVKTFLKILCDRSITVLQKHMKLFCNNTLYFTHVLFKFVVTDFYTILIKY